MGILPRTQKKQSELLQRVLQNFPLSSRGAKISHRKFVMGMHGDEANAIESSFGVALWTNGKTFVILQQLVPVRGAHWARRLLGIHLQSSEHDVLEKCGGIPRRNFLRKRPHAVQ